MPTIRDLRRWTRELDGAAARIGPRFSRKDLRTHAGNYLRGLISRVERKNGWQLAEELGEATPTNLQHFIARATWNADEVRDDLREYVAEHLGDDEAVLIVDETGFLKKGTKSVGVHRQYSGTAGRIENCQIGVFLAYRSRHGHALVDRALYLPKSWAEDSVRRAEAKVPESVEFATKPALAREMLRRTLATGLPCRWATADEIYGGDFTFRQLLEDHGLCYVVAVSRQQKLWSPDIVQRRVEHYADEVPRKAWRELSCGMGTKGERFYRWTYLPFGKPQQRPGGTVYAKGLLVRESSKPVSLEESAERAYYLTLAPADTPLVKLAEIAGARWAVEECFEQAKQLTGLDEYEVRSWDGWHRHVTLSMLAHATLSVLRRKANAAHRVPQDAAPKKQRTQAQRAALKIPGPRRSSR
jgi:SRSO17 transposase